MSRHGDDLIRLGDMIGDGLADEPGGAWIRAAYRRTAKDMGIDIPKPRRRNNAPAINEHMKRRVADVRCTECSGALQQTRSGSKRAVCVSCGTEFRLLG